MIVKARNKPILSMLEWIRVRFISKMYIKKIDIEKYGGKLCPSIQDKLEKLKIESKNFCVMPSRRFVYKFDNERERHVVDLVGRTCSCRVWDLTRILYKHGVVAFLLIVRNQRITPIHATTRMLLWRHTRHSYLANLSRSQMANLSLLHLLSISH